MVHKLMKSFALSLIYIKFNLLTLRQNKNNNFMFPNEKVMADQKTLIFPSKNFAFFTLTDAQKTLIIWP